MTPITLHLSAVAPLGTLDTGPGDQSTRACVVPVYPSTLAVAGGALYAHRKALGLSAGQAARLLGVSFLDYLMLEQGRYTLASDQEWLEAARRLERG